jgi:uncharacterized protein DUF4430
MGRRWIFDGAESVRILRFAARSLTTSATLWVEGMWRTALAEFASLTLHCAGQWHPNPTSSTMSSLKSVVVAVMALAATIGCRERPSETPATSSATHSASTPSGQGVQLTIDYGDGAEKRFTAIPFRDGTTVLDVLEAAKAHSHGITFASRGSGAMTLVTKIDDVANQEGAAGAKNWLFFVNDKLADRGCGAASVKPGDSILWRYQVKE